jgi:hypothetical protein
MKLLMVNGHAQRCGVYQFGANLFVVLRTHDDYYGYTIGHQGFADAETFLAGVENHDGIILNWHAATMNWMHNGLLAQVRAEGKKVILIPHDEDVRFSEVDAILFIDPTIDPATLPPKQFVMGRPVFPGSQIPPYGKRFTVGFGGFAFDHKGIEKIIGLCQQEGIVGVVRLHLPPSDYGYNPSYISSLHTQFEQGLPGVHIELSEGFISTYELVDFMAGNDINIFPYEDQRVVNRGISSITDIALASRRPFMISRSNMFRHFLEEDRELMTIGKVGIMECFMRYKENDYLEKYRQLWSPEENKRRLANVVKEIQ